MDRVPCIHSSSTMCTPAHVKCTSKWRQTVHCTTIQELMNYQTHVILFKAHYAKPPGWAEQCGSCHLKSGRLHRSKNTIRHVSHWCKYSLWVNSKMENCLCMPSVLWRCWLGGRKGTWPVKNWVVGYWHGYVSESRCRFPYGPADATAIHYLLLQ